jgi:hypothetical protein
MMNNTRSPSPRNQPPLGTRHRHKRHRGNSEPFHHAPAESRSHPNATHSDDLTSHLKELETLPDLIKQKFTTWQDGARPFQMECMRAQVLHQDVLLHAATGSGKTGIAAGPHLLPSSKGKVTLFVSPLLSLHDEQVNLHSRFKKCIRYLNSTQPQVTTFKEEFGLTAVAVNSSNGGCSRKLAAVRISSCVILVILTQNTCRRLLRGHIRL